MATGQSRESWSATLEPRLPQWCRLRNEEIQVLWDVHVLDATPKGVPEARHLAGQYT